MANGHGGKRAGAGKKKGQVHPQTRAAKEAIEMAFEGIGGVKRLTQWAEQNEGDFFKLLFPKLLPVQVNHADNEGEKLEGFKVILVGKAG